MSIKNFVKDIVDLMSDVRDSKPLKAQSAMEYLMTYGWAILIVAIVLTALFQLGVFGSASLTGTSCIAIAGYLCKSPTLTSAGLLTFTFGQSTGSPLYNVQIACVATTDATGMPYPATAYNSFTTSGAVLPYSTTANTLVNGQTITISQLPCYTSSGSQFSGAIGSGYAGYIWTEYTTQSTPEGAGNLWNVVKALNIHIKSST